MPRFKVLLIDALTIKNQVAPHFNLPQALAVISRAKPEKAILIGCGHEYFYSDVRRVLKKVQARENIRVKMGFDLLNFSLDSSMF